MFVALSAVGVDLVGPRRLDGATFTTIVLFAGIGWGIQRLSRVAATLGLACYLSERAYSAAIHGPSGTLSAIAIALFFLHGVRGTFAYQSLQRNRA